MERSRKSGRGRRARAPWQIPWTGWKDIGFRLRRELNRDNIGIIAAGVAFFGLMGIIPTLVALVSVYGLVFDPAEVQTQLDLTRGVLPAEVIALLGEQLTRITAQSDAALSLTLIGGILVALWSGSKSVKALMTSLNIAYDEEEGRGFIKQNLLGVFYTLALVVGGIFAIALVAVAPAVLNAIGLGGIARDLISWGRWPVLFMGVLFALAAIYRFFPNRREARWQWLSVGSIVATALWLGGSALFSWYVSEFGKYNETYGSLGAVVILLLWFHLSAYVILLGAEINAEIEHQTAEDSTRAPEKPMGERGAYVADTLGEERPDQQRRRKAG